MRDYEIPMRDPYIFVYPGINSGFEGAKTMHPSQWIFFGYEALGRGASGPVSRAHDNSGFES